MTDKELAELDQTLRQAFGQAKTGYERIRKSISNGYNYSEDREAFPVYMSALGSLAQAMVALSAEQSRRKDESEARKSPLPKLARKDSPAAGK